jgi:hypothetical protein
VDAGAGGAQPATRDARRVGALPLPYLLEPCLTQLFSKILNKT